MNKQFEGNQYEVPLHLMERFDQLTTKLIYAKQENFTELYCGYSIVFKAEFDEYRV